jgi:transcriptional regulator NrdR family protein
MAENYSHTKCPKCEHTHFEFVDDNPTNSSYVLYYLRCSSCKTFLSSFEYLNINTQIEGLKKLINEH